MRHNKRRTGLDAINSVSWGTHLCQFYETKEDMIDILVPYFKSGLEDNEFCMWVTSELLGVDEAQAALGRAVGSLDDYIARDQLEIVDYKDWYAREGRFDIDGVLQRWLEAEQSALDKGFDGLRVAGNVSRLRHDDWPSLIDYEASVNIVIGKHRMIALCSYPLLNFPAFQLMHIVLSHAIILVRRAGEWVAIENSRSAQIRTMNKRGFSYATIGRRLGVTKERIRQMIHGKSSPEKKLSPMITSTEAARLLNVHVNTIRRWSDEGILRAYRIGARGDRRFKRRDIDVFLSTTASTALSSSGMRRARSLEQANS